MLKSSSPSLFYHAQLVPYLQIGCTYDEKKPHYFRVLNKKLGEIGGWRGWGRGKVNSIQPEKIIFWTVKIFYCRLHPKTLEDLSTMTKGFEKIQHFGGNSILPICFSQYQIFKGNKRIWDLDFQTVFFQENSPWLLDYTTSSYKKSLAEILSPLLLLFGWRCNVTKE